MLTASSPPPLILPIWMGVSMTLCLAVTHSPFSLHALVCCTQPPWPRTCQALRLPAPTLETLATRKAGLRALCCSPQCPGVGQTGAGPTGAGHVAAVLALVTPLMAADLKEAIASVATGQVLVDGRGVELALKISQAHP